MKISLLMPTLGREKEVKELLESLKNQSYKNFELIVVDQNNDDRVFNIVEEYNQDLEIKYVKSKIKGLSYNRNIGLEHVGGDLLTLTDDDAEYPEKLLENIVEKFKENPSMDIISVSTEDKVSGKTIHKSPDNSQEINFKNVFKTVISLTAFIKIKKVEDLKFDEKLGLGAEFGSAEETDMILNILHKDYKGVYIKEPSLVIYHPYKDGVTNPERSYSYGLGMGALMKKEIIYRKNYKFIPQFINSLNRPMIGIFLYIFNNNKRTHYINTFFGRIKGFVGYE